MKLFTLRQAIYERLNEIREERRALQDERKQLLDRLEKLEEQTSGIDTASVINSLNETVQSLSELIPHVPATVVIQEIAKKIQSNGVKIEVNNNNNVDQTRNEIKQAAVEAKVNTKPNKRQNYSMREVGRIICTYIREQGGVAKNRDIEKYLLEEHGIKYKDISQALWNIRQVTPELKRGRQGYSRVVDLEPETVK